MHKARSFQDLRRPQFPVVGRKHSHQEIRVGKDVPPLGDVMVFGGCGFIGSHLVASLISNPSYGHVSVLSRSPRSNHHPEASYHVCDITSPARLQDLIRKLQPRIVFYCVTPAPGANSKEFKKTYVTGTETLLHAANEASCIEAIVFTSSHLAVQLPRRGVKLTEELSMLHTSSSSSTPAQKYKAKAESLVLTASGSKVKTCALRLPPVYGEGDPYLVTEFFSLLRQGKSNVQIGSNTTMFEWLYVKNAVHAHLLAAASLLHPQHHAQVTGQAFFITDAHPVPYYTFARKIWLNAGDRPEDDEIRKVPKALVRMSAGINDWAIWTASLGFKRPGVRIEDVKRLDEGFEWSGLKAEILLGYRPFISVDQGVKRAVREALKREEWKNLELRGRLAA